MHFARAFGLFAARFVQFEVRSAQSCLTAFAPTRLPYCRVKLIVTVTSTATGTPFRRVGVYSHCRTASSAA